MNNMPEYARSAMFFKRLDNKVIRCEICFRRCVISPGHRGYCRVRENRDGELDCLVYAEPSAVHVDPIEKEPQHHMLPGTNMLSIGTVGCNFSCNHCHNWHLSQLSPGDLDTYVLPPEDAVHLALQKQVPTISFTYNEPAVFYEYMYDIAALAHEKSLKILWHSNGVMNPGPLKKLLEFTDAVTIDLKGFTDDAYANFGATLKPVLKTMEIIRDTSAWMEIVNLVIPSVNDHPDDIKTMCEYIHDTIGPDTPLHFSRFFPTYKMAGADPTPVTDLEHAREIAIDTGLSFVTLGNIPGHRFNSTYCPECGKRLIHREQYHVIKNEVNGGRCRHCNREIPGIWE